MIIIEMIAPSLAEALCHKITADLPEYFGLPEVNKHYALGVRSRINWAAKVDDEYVGLISIDFPYPKNANIYWIGILRSYHLQNIGKRLTEEAFLYAKDMNARTISVETLSPQESDENYIRTYNFYESLGFYPLFNLKPESYEWNMVYMIKDLNEIHLNRASGVLVRTLVKEDISAITQAFNQIGWNKPASLFERYLQEHEIGTRQIWIAHIQDQFAGYITLQLQSEYLPFKARNIPEIKDFNVLPQFRKKGIGSLLLNIAENNAVTKSEIIGIGVGLYGGDDGGYGAAQRLYIKRGYVPDGRGITYNYQPTIPGNSYSLDDELIIWLEKKLS